MSNKKILSILFFISIVVASFNPLGKEALAGSFSHSCKDINVDENFHLSANCTNRSGDYRPSSLDLNSRIGNKDGFLTTSGGFLGTCKNPAWDHNTTISANCKTYNGDWRSTSLNLDDVISNNDGSLGFDQ